jgi:hypothetical protein
MISVAMISVICSTSGWQVRPDPRRSRSLDAMAGGEGGFDLGRQGGAVAGGEDNSGGTG